MRFVTWEICWYVRQRGGDRLERVEVMALWESLCWLCSAPRSGTYWANTGTGVSPHQGTPSPRPPPPGRHLMSPYQLPALKYHYIENNDQLTWCVSMCTLYVASVYSVQWTVHCVQSIHQHLDWHSHCYISLLSSSHFNIINWFLHVNTWKLQSSRKQQQQSSHQS